MNRCSEAEAKISELHTHIKNLEAEKNRHQFTSSTLIKEREIVTSEIASLKSIHSQSLSQSDMLRQRCRKVLQEAEEKSTRYLKYDKSKFEKERREAVETELVKELKRQAQIAIKESAALHTKVTFG